MEKRPAHNSTYKKLAVQWLNEALCFVSSSVVADSFRLRNRQLLVAAKRCRLWQDNIKLIAETQSQIREETWFLWWLIQIHEWVPVGYQPDKYFWIGERHCW